MDRNQQRQMDKDQQRKAQMPASDGKETNRPRTLDEKIDEALEQTFPASDPPSYSQPGNKDIKKNT